MHQPISSNLTWPPLLWESWKDSCETLHMWTQIVGKVKLGLTPFLNEWWNVGFEVSARGLMTGLIPTGERVFEMNFDFVEHKLQINVSDGKQKTLYLYARSVADFYSEFIAALRSIGISVAIDTRPVEIPTAQVPFDQNHAQASYDADAVQRWWKILVQTTRVLQRYRSHFSGKSSPILFYWGSFDLSATRFSGRPATLPTSGPRFYRIAEDQENVSCGFWPGNTTAAGVSYGAPAFYSYTYPAPANLAHASLRANKAYFDEELGEFILRYERLLVSPDPDQLLLDFFESAYEAGANLAHWDRSILEQEHRL